MNFYGLREARQLIADERRIIAASSPRPNDPFTRGMRQALGTLDNRIKRRMEEYKKDPTAPKSQ